MRKQLRIVRLVQLMILLVLSMSRPLYTQAETEEEGAAGFTYSLRFPENQIEENSGYYHLKMTPGKKQTIELSLLNPSQEEITVNIGLNGAKTNQNGVIEYGDSTIENDASLKHDFVDLITGPERVTLAAGETKTVSFQIEMPETGIEGIVAGGIQLMKDSKGDSAPTQGGSQIINQYAYVIGVLFQESEETVPADLSFNKVFVGQSNYRNTIFVDFSNVMPAFLNEMTVETQITEKGKAAVLFERKQTAMRMAPNSFLQFPVSMNGERMKAGTYEAKILVTSGDQKWAWTEEFEITQDDANKFNERDVGLVQEKGLNWQLIALIVGAVLLLIGIIFGIMTYVRKKKQQKELEAKKARKKKKVTQHNGKKDH